MEFVVDDRAFLIGLTELFRREMKAYEVNTLLPLAEVAAGALGLAPAHVPVEGYYGESIELTRFFELVRALQQAGRHELPPGPSAEAIKRLRGALCSPAMGRVVESDRLLPRMTGPFGEALRLLADWSIGTLCQQAQALVRDDDAGLVALAAATRDPVALCVAREAAALTGDVELAEVDSPHFTWTVSPDVERVAARFVGALAQATAITLPAPTVASAAVYGVAARDADVLGRCTLVGERSGNPKPFYHWYIDAQGGGLLVKDFWSSAIWTTADLRSTPAGRRPEAGARVGAAGESGVEVGARGSPEKGARGWSGWLERAFRRKR